MGQNEPHIITQITNFAKVLKQAIFDFVLFCYDELVILAIARAIILDK